MSDDDTINIPAPDDLPPDGEYPPPYSPGRYPPPYWDDSYYRPKQAGKSKTLWTGLGVMAYGLLSLLMDHPLVSENPKLASLLFMAVGALMIGLRFLTNQSVSPVFRFPGRRGF